MIAFLVVSAPALSSLSLYLSMLTVVPIGLLLAPSGVRRDKRVIVALALIGLGVIGVPVFAAVTSVCSYVWWFAWECWFL